MTKEVSPERVEAVVPANALRFAARKRRYNAFTLIELLVVIGIIIVLAGIGFKHSRLCAKERRSFPRRNRNRRHVRGLRKLQGG